MILDLAGFSKVPNGAHSVTEGKIIEGYAHPKGFTPVWTVKCVQHGACLNVAITDNGFKIWRCPACNEGCYQPHLREARER